MKKPPTKKTTRRPLKIEKGKYLKHDKFELLDVSLIKSLESDFTTCIINLPWFEISGGELDVFELVANEIEPLLSKEAVLLVKVETSTYSIAERVFSRLGFKIDTELVEVSGNFHKLWLMFLSEDHSSIPRISKTVFSYRKTPQREESFYRQMDPDYTTTPQAFLREVLELLCPKPRKAKVLVPYFRFGCEIAACQALGIKSVGYDSIETYADETILEKIRDTIVCISKFK